jgi:hypothetical protein
MMLPISPVLAGLSMWLVRKQPPGNLSDLPGKRTMQANDLDLDN